MFALNINITQRLGGVGGFFNLLWDKLSCNKTTACKHASTCSFVL